LYLIIVFILVVRPITIEVTQRIEMSESDELIRGVAKLRSEIYVLFRTGYSVSNVFRIRVFEDQYPFRLQTEINTEIIDSYAIVSSEKENCLYVSDCIQNCVWKITRETDDQNKIIKWLATDYRPGYMSLSRDGELLVINKSSHSLVIYGSDAEFIRSIPLRRDIEDPLHAVETSIGNFIIIDIHTKDEHEHEDEDEDENEEEEVKEEEGILMEEGKQKELVSVVSDKDEDENEDKDEEEEKEEQDVVMEEGKHADWSESRQGKGGSYRRKWEFDLSELTRDGQMVIRRFIPSSETQLDRLSYLSFDSDDRVFVADELNHKVILLDSDLKWNRILCPTKEDKEEQILMGPDRFFYDEEMKQLIVTGFSHKGSQVNVYTLRL